MSVKIAGHFEFQIADAVISGTERALQAAGLSTLRITGAVNTPKLAGIAGGVEGRTLLLVNASGANLTIVQHNDSANGATPQANRIVTANTTLFDGTGLLVFYDGRRQLWITVGRG